MYVVANAGRTAYGIQSMLLDTEIELYAIDVNTLTPGSDVFVAETSNRYVLNQKREWILVKQSGGGDGFPPYSHIIYDGGHVDQSATIDNKEE